LSGILRVGHRIQIDTYNITSLTIDRSVSLISKEVAVDACFSFARNFAKAIHHGCVPPFPFFKITISLTINNNKVSVFENLKGIY